VKKSIAPTSGDQFEKTTLARAAAQNCEFLVLFQSNNDEENHESNSSPGRAETGVQAGTGCYDECLDPFFTMILGETAGILGEIVTTKEAEVKSLLPKADELRRKAEKRVSERRPFERSLLDHDPAVIAEVKKASPSKGLLQPRFDPALIARNYESGGAACVSVLTDGKYFQGSLDDLERARQAITLPVLRKDFTIHPVQIFEAAAHGADAILLLAAILSVAELKTFRELARELGMAALVEVHCEEELKRALDSGATLIGVNNRNLQTFEVSLDTSLRLSEHIPNDVIKVSESGIFTRADIDMLRGAGFEAFLIGESLMRSGDSVAALRTLLQ
jgi:indole-3-glycerol phosphate synthase